LCIENVYTEATRSINQTKLETKVNCQHDLSKLTIIFPIINTYQTSFPLPTYPW